MLIQEKVSLAEYTSWLIGGPAEHFCLPTHLDELKSAIGWAHEHQKNLTILGGGTNVLISDQGVRGLVCCLRRYSGYEVKEENQKLHIIAQAGTAKSELLKVFLKYKLAPALFLAGLPGDVGGGVVMNAGVAESFQPREFCELVDWVEVLRWAPSASGIAFEIKKYLKEDIQWSYRHSHGWQPGIIVRVGLSWPLEKDETILEKVKLANRTRLSKQPLDLPSCGSVFKNPEGHKAAQLIDSCGLKGHRFGDAQVSTKHANFIVNIEQAKAQDVWDLIQYVKKTVLEQKQVELSTEVVRLGEW